MIRKISAFILCVLMLITTASATWCQPCIDKLEADGIIPSIQFDANKYISRIDFVALVCKSKGLNASAENYGEGYRQLALNNGIVAEMANDPVTTAGTICRNEAALILYENYKNTMEVKNTAWMADSLNDYRDIPDTYKEAVSQLYLNGIISGRDDGKYHGWNALTVGEALTLIYKTKYPEYRTEHQLNDFKYMLSEYTTYTNNDSNRNFNINRAAESINGTMLNPGEQFSYNAVVGNAGKAQGYKQANIISGGKYVKGYGGGICQDATTLYNAALKANLQIDERHAHALKSTYIEPGWDATVYNGSLDLKFTNTQPYPIKIQGVYDDATKAVTFRIYCTEDIPLDNVNIYVTGKGRSWNLYREVDGVLNYTTHSTYRKN